MPPTAAIILAGGRSSRMGVEKSLMDFGGAPVIARVIERLAPQVTTLAINANGDAARFARFALPVIADLREDFPGPLAGIAAGIAYACAQSCDWLATAPCDAPFIPRDLVARLHAQLSLGGVAIASSTQGIEPLFGLWSVDALPDVEAALMAGERAVHELATKLGAIVVHIENESGAPDWALNLNRPQEVADALAFAEGLRVATRP